MNRRIILFMSAVATAKADLLYTIGPNNLGVPNQLVAIDTTAASVTPVVALGVGSTGYAGGIASQTSTGSFFGFESDLNSVPTLVAYNTAGVVTPLAGFGVPMLPGGLDLVAGTPLWTMNDGQGNWATTVQGIGVVAGGTGLVTGTAYQGSSGRIFVVSNDGAGFSTLIGIDPFSGTPVYSALLGFGFTGGLAWNPQSNLFYLIGSDNLGTSTLYTFDENGSALTALFRVGDGFVNSSLTLAPAPPSPVPEPSSWVICATAFALLCLRARGRGAS